MVRFSLVIVLVMMFTLGVLWLLRENPYGLLPGSGILFTVNTDKMLQCQNADGSVTPIPTPGVPYNAFQLFWKPILFISLLNLLLIIVFSLFYSHSMAGPVLNIKNSLRDLRDGKPARPIRIRKGDQFQEMVDLLNEVIEKRVK